MPPFCDGLTPFVAAVAATPDGKPVRIKLRRVSGFSSSAVSVFAKRCLAASCAVVSDGLPCFAAVTKAGCSHQTIKTGGGAASAHKPAFKWVNIASVARKTLDLGCVSARPIDLRSAPKIDPSSSLEW